MVCRGAGIWRVGHPLEICITLQRSFKSLSWKKDSPYPKVDVQLVIPADRAGIPSNFIFTLQREETGRWRRSKPCQKKCCCHGHYGLHPDFTPHPCDTLRNSQYMSFESAVGVFHLCGSDGSQPRWGENRSGSGILKLRTTQVRMQQVSLPIYFRPHMTLPFTT